MYYYISFFLVVYIVIDIDAGWTKMVDIVYHTLTQFWEVLVNISHMQEVNIWGIL